MKYIYYIAGMFLVVTATVFLLQADFQVNVSKPAVVVNDRIISEDEFREIAESRAPTSHMEDIVDSVVTNELLIQEALARKINKEEAFRRSVENFYEQSLIKILIDRKFDSLAPEIPAALVDRYIDCSGKKIVFTKYVFENSQALETNNYTSRKRYKKPFETLSAGLKYLFLTLEPGETSPGEQTELGVVAYLFEEKQALADARPVTDLTRIKDFLIQQKKSEMFDNWLEDLEKKADIQVFYP